MAAKLVYLFTLLFLAKLGLGESQFAERVPQLLHNRASFLGGISLYAETPETGEDGVCPSYTQTVDGSCCPDGCCPLGTYGYVHGDYCCPTDEDCSAEVDSAPVCANSTWIMYKRPDGAVSPYFCCEPDQIALYPNLCVPNNGTYAAASQAPTAIQIIGTLPGGSSTSTPAGTMSTASPSTTSAASSTPKTSGTSLTGSATPKGNLTTTGTPSVSKASTSPTTTVAGSPAGTSSASSTPSSKAAGAARSFVAGDWPWGMAVLVAALGFGMRLVL